MKGEIIFSTSGIKDGMQEKLGKNFGITQADMPCMRIYDTANNSMKYLYEGDVTNIT